MPFSGREDDNIHEDADDIHHEELMTDDEDNVLTLQETRKLNVAGTRRRGDDRDDEVENEDDGEELFGDNMEEDYRQIPDLDVYDTKHFDDSEYSEISLGDRIAAEAEMRRRDREAGRLKARMRRGLEVFDSSSEMDDFRVTALKKKKLLGRMSGTQDVSAHVHVSF